MGSHNDELVIVVGIDDRRLRLSSRNKGHLCVDKQHRVNHSMIIMEQ